jgi:outer membrane receptor protein involved in Fe transport
MLLLRRFLILNAVLLAAASILLAADSGTLEVKTTMKGGAAFPGVIVDIKNTKGLAVPKAKATDGTGTATFMLPPGSGYEVTVSAPGFNTITTPDLKIEMNRTKKVLYEMSEQLKVSVKVIGGKVVDLDEGGEGKVTFSDQFVEDLPVLGKNYQNVLTLAPGVNDSNGDGNPNVHGARERDFKATVDGVSNVDPLTGTFMSNINPDAIEEIEVVTTGASAEYGRAVGGFGKIITKQGGNTFEVTASVYFRSYLFDGNTNQIPGQPTVTYHDVRPSLNVTGPVIKDKLFFALFHEYLDIGRPVNLVGAPSLVVVTKGSRNLDKLTWQVSPRNKLIFQAQTDPLKQGPSGIDSYTDPRSGYDYSQGGPTYQLRWNAQASSSLNVESLFAYSHTGIGLTPVSDNIKNNCVVDTVASTRQSPFGGPGPAIDDDYCFESKTSRRSGAYYVTYSDNRIRYTWKSDATYFLENFLGVSHTLKGGVVAEKEHYGATDSQRAYSLFTETLSGGGIDNPVTSGGGILQRTIYDPLYPDTLKLSSDGITYGLYFEDQFRPHPNVSVRLGVRIENETLSAPGWVHVDPRAEYEEFRSKYDSCTANPATCTNAYVNVFTRYQHKTTGAAAFSRYLDQVPPRQPENFRITNTNIGPRFSVSWDPKGDQKTKFFATAGRVYDKIFLGAITDEQGPDSLNYYYRVDPDISNSYRLPRIVNQSDSQANFSAPSIYQVTRDLKTPYVDEYTIGFSREIAPETSITLTYISRFYEDQFQYIDINHYGQDLGNPKTMGCAAPGPNSPSVPIDTRKDGKFDDCGGRVVPIPGPPPFFRPIFVEVPDKLPDLYLRNPFFNNINQVGNYNKTRYKAYELELTRRLHRNWQLEGSYVYSKAVGNAEDYLSSLGADPTTRQKEKGYLSYDQRHFLKINLTTQIPLWNLRLGSSFNWASGLPYSITRTDISRDQKYPFGGSYLQYSQGRLAYPTQQRNDQRNQSYWLFNVNAKKDFTLGKANVEASVEVFNLLNNDYLLVEEYRNSSTIAQRAIGRQFQIGAKFSF